MKNRIIVVANLGAFKAYKVQQDGNSSPRLEEIPTPDAPNEHSKRSNTLTVMEGRSASNPSNPRATATASDGEQHNMELEKRRRAIKKIAENIQRFLSNEPSGTCALAAPKEILGQIVDEVHPTMRARLDKTLPLDLTRAPKLELLEQFCPRVLQPK
jgi:hypothetical protein